MRFPGRFEWKILSALLLVALLSLGASAYVLGFTIKNVTAYTAQHQAKVRTSLDGAADLFRSYFSERKETFRRVAGQIAAAPPSRLADLEGVPDLLRARLLQGDAVADEWQAPPEIAARAREAPPTLVETAGGTTGTPRLLELTFGIPAEMYASFLRLRDAMERERELDRIHPIVFPRIFRAFLVALVSILILTTIMGLVLARRATGRVAALSRAARRVGEGDLTVRVAPTGKDELDDLGRAFDRMVGELRDARSRLEYMQKVSAWQEVARRLAHEIKNPLTPIQLSIQELASKYPGDDPGYRKLLDTAIEILAEEIGGLRRLVDDFSAFARLPPKVDPAPLDLAVVVEDFMRAHAEWQPFVHFERPPVAVTALGDRVLLRRVLANLVENAVQAAEGMGRAPAVRIAVETRPGRSGGATAAIIVEDNGPGVPAGDRSRVFDPYVTTKETGTGLGLAIVRKIVIDHGGDVTADAAATPLGGARFTVEIPAAPR